jgi:hypothetical protein
MALRIIQIHPAEDAQALNTEWFVIENTGEKVFHTKHCVLGVTRGTGKARGELGTLDPGFTIAPGEKVRLVTGNPGRKAHGTAPEDDIKNYNLFLGASVLQGAGTVLVFSLRSHELARAEFDPKQKNGIAKGTK